MNRRLKSTWMLYDNHRKVSKDILAQTKVRVSITPGPRYIFTAAEFAAMKAYIESWGSIFFMLGEGGESKYQANINLVRVNEDAVAKAT